MEVMKPKLPRKLVASLLSISRNGSRCDGFLCGGLQAGWVGGVNWRFMVHSSAHVTGYPKGLHFYADGQKSHSKLHENSIKQSLIEALIHILIAQ
jgi:hypothetical protein